MTDIVKRHPLHRSLWVKCLAASFLLHAIFLFVFLQYPFILTHPLHSLFIKSQPTPKWIQSDSEEPLLSDNVLEEAFEELVVSFASDEPEEMQMPAAALSPSLENNLLPHTLSESVVLLSVPSDPLLLDQTFETRFPQHEANPISLANPILEENQPSRASLDNVLVPFVSLIDIPQISQEKDFFEPFSENDVLSISDHETAPVLETIRPLNFQDRAPQKAMIVSVHSDLTPLESMTYFSDARFTRIDSFSYASSSESPPSISQVPPYAELNFSDIEEYLPEQIISSVQWNDSFDLGVRFFPEDDGYVFCLSLSPKYDLQSERMRQNLYFLIDASSGVEKHKLAIFKRSVLKALSTLEPGDTFNIILLDKKITKLSNHNLSYSLKSLHAAEDFLKKPQDRPLFSSFNLFQCLTNIMDQIQDDGEIHTAILLTNGHTSLNFQNQKNQLNQYLDKNNGKVSLYTAAVGQNNNIVHLDMLSSLSGGKLLYSDTNASFPRKLSTFIKSLRSPLAKDIILTVQASDPKANFSLLPISSQLPNLYNNEPYVVMGKIDRLCDLSFVLQGKHDDEWVYISKTIHFEEGEKAEGSLKKEWKVRQATEQYDLFLKEAKGKHLKEAKELLKAVYGRAFNE
jgi:hypothetical protein